MLNESFKSVAEIFNHRVGSTPDSTAMWGRRDDRWEAMTWADVAAVVRDVACGLHAMGIEEEQRVAILCETRPEWVCVDLGILCAAGCTTTLYPSSSPEEALHILNDSQSIFCFVETESQAAMLAELAPELPHLKKVIVIDGGTTHGFQMSLEELQSIGAAWYHDNPSQYEMRVQGIRSEQLATLIYTSGTTGPPKGVMLTHDNWVFESEAIDKLAILQPEDKHYLFLPLAHAFAKVLQIGFIRLGVPTVVDGNLERLVDNLAETKPTVLGAVPRVFEKAYNAIRTKAREAGGTRLKVFNWAMKTGKEVSELRQQGLQPSGALAVQYRMANRLVFSRLKDQFGGRIKYFVSGGAPLSKDIAEFFHAADLLILEGYGLTESSAASVVNRPNAYRFGSVGRAIPGVEIRIDEDGEVLLGGRGIMRGYHNQPEATREALTEDGWLRTGDIGHLEDAFLRITDRKKDIIVTAGGKNIAPQNFENQLKASSRWVSQVVLHGDKRPYCVALISIDMEAVSGWAKANQIKSSDPSELASHPAVHDLIWADVQALNARRASYEKVKKIGLLDYEISQETGELTPTLKVKRRAVETRHKKLLDSLYED
ncbi:MAG: long-chain fatty acid--CoA ligase [Myxococcota bacterium]|nr:long-chain fatty acid--CoA ligase [Myxococcota bacterium]